MTNVKTYIKKQIPVKAIQVTEDNKDEVREFIENNDFFEVEIGDYVIKDVDGEFSSVDKEYFEETYEEIRILVPKKKRIEDE